MGRFFTVGAILLLFLISCATTVRTNETELDAAGPDSSAGTGEIALESGVLAWERFAADADIGVRFENRSELAVTVRLAVPRQQVGTRTRYEERQVGIEEVEYCDPITQECSILRQPVYDLVPVREPVYSSLRVRPRRFTLEPGAASTVMISRSSSQAQVSFTATLHVRVGGLSGPRQLIVLQFGE